MNASQPDLVDNERERSELLFRPPEHARVAVCALRSCRPSHGREPNSPIGRCRLAAWLGRIARRSIAT
jgi:hypothetical protein